MNVATTPAKRRRQVVRMRDEWGWTFQRIATKLGVSRQRAWQLYREANRGH